MLIRNMTSADIPAVVDIERKCFTIPWSLKSFEESIQRGDTIFLVCEESFGVEDRILGYMGMYLSFEEASITNVAVLPEFQNKGYGSMLVETAKAEVKKMCVKKMFLEVRISNQPAISLYKKKGFQEIGIRKRFYEQPTEDACIMECDLEIKKI